MSTQQRQLALEKSQQRFEDGVTKLLRDLGAVDTEETSEAKWASMYSLAVKTKAGLLLLSVSADTSSRKLGCGGSVFGRFPDVEQAKKFFKVDRLYNHAGLNVYSGKWNHHYFGWSRTCACKDIHQTIERIQ